MVVPSPDPFGSCCQFGARRDHAARHLTVEETLAPGVPSLIEDAPVRVHPLLGHVVGCVHGAQREVQEERFARGTLLLILHHADGLIGQVLAQVIPLVGPPGWIDVVVVADEVGRPMVGVALEEAVVALEAQTQWPRIEGPGRRAVPARRQVPLAHGHGRVAGVTEEAGEGRRRLGQPGVVARETQRDVGQKAHADGVMVAAGEEGGPGGRAQRGHVEAVEGRAAGRQRVHVRRADVGSEGAQVTESRVVEDDGHDVGRPLGRLRDSVGSAAPTLRR